MCLRKEIALALAASLALCEAGFSISPPPKNAPGVILLEETSQAFTQIAEKAMPATVSIKVQVTQTQQEMMPPFDMFGDDFFRRFFQMQPSPSQPQTQVAAGSGFFISSDGYVVTNNHVIKDATQITVLLNDGREYPAVVKGSDPRTDLAVLKIEEKDLPYLTFGDSEDLKVGEWLVAIGNPFGMGGTLTVGVVSAKGRQDLGIAAYEDFIQTDAAINPGNSGGPALNLQGEVIGVNTAILTRSGGYMGIGLAIPSKMAQNVIDQIIDTGTVKRAYLGIILQPLDKELADAMNVEKQEGILISDVIKGSPAEKAGLQPGDILLQSNDKPIKSANKFRNEIGMMSPGMELKLKILRNNKPLILKVTLGSQKEGEVFSAEILQKIGVEVENLTPEIAVKLGYSPDMAGIVISKIKPGSPAALAGLRPYSLITGVIVNRNAQKEVRNTNEFEEALKQIGDQKHLVLIVRQQNFQRYYTIKFN